MDDKVQARLEMLRGQYALGERQLAEVESRRAQLTETMLRIGGAIQVLEELVGERPAAEDASENGAEVAAPPAA